MKKLDILSIATAATMLFSVSAFATEVDHKSATEEPKVELTAEEGKTTELHSQKTVETTKTEKK